MNLLEKPPLKLGIALGGGGLLGTAHLGALQALEDHQIYPQMITGTSVGALIAAQYAFGISPKEIKDSVKHLNWWSVSKFSLSRHGLMRNENMKEFLLSKIGPVKFSDSPIKLAFIATDLVSGEKVILDNGYVADAAMISATVPGLYSPHEYDGHWLVDGGLVENLPTTPLHDNNMDFVLGLNINSANSEQRPDSMIDILIAAFDIAIDNHTNVLLEQTDYLMQLDCSSLSRTNNEATEQLYELGYETCSQHIETLKQAMNAKSPGILDAVNIRIKSLLE